MTIIFGDIRDHTFYRIYARTTEGKTSTPEGIEAYTRTLLERNGTYYVETKPRPFDKERYDTLRRLYHNSAEGNNATSQEKDDFVRIVLGMDDNDDDIEFRYSDIRDTSIYKLFASVYEDSTPEEIEAHVSAHYIMIGIYYIENEFESSFDETLFKLDIKYGSATPEEIDALVQGNLGIVIPYEIAEPTSTPTPSVMPTYIIQEEVKQPIQLPHNGYIVYPNAYGYPENGSGVLTIKASPSDNYFIKLRDSRTDELVLSFIVHAGKSVDVNVPFGEYELTYACGDEWYGYDELFGDDTSYHKAEDTFEFEDYGDSVTWWTVELYLQYDGNLDTYAINPDKF